MNLETFFFQERYRIHPREFIGLSFDKAKFLAESKGLKVRRCGFFQFLFVPFTLVTPRTIFFRVKKDVVTDVEF